MVGWWVGGWWCCRGGGGWGQVGSDGSFHRSTTAHCRGGGGGRGTRDETRDERTTVWRRDRCVAVERQRILTFLTSLVRRTLTTVCVRPALRGRDDDSVAHQDPVGPFIHDSEVTTHRTTTHHRVRPAVGAAAAARARVVVVVVVHRWRRRRRPEHDVEVEPRARCIHVDDGGDVRVVQGRPDHPYIYVPHYCHHHL